MGNIQKNNSNPILIFIFPNSMLYQTQQHQHTNITPIHSSPQPPSQFLWNQSKMLSKAVSSTKCPTNYTTSYPSTTTSLLLPISPPTISPSTTCWISPKSTPATEMKMRMRIRVPSLPWTQLTSQQLRGKRRRLCLTETASLRRRKRRIFASR